MRGRTPFATALGAPLGQVASKIVKGSCKALRPNRFPQHPHILLSGFPPFPQIGHVPVDFAGALSGSTAGNRRRPLVAHHGSSSTAEEASNFGLRFPMPGVLLHLALPLRSSVRSLVSGRAICGTPAG